MRLARGAEAAALSDEGAYPYPLLAAYREVERRWGYEAAVLVGGPEGACAPVRLWSRVGFLFAQFLHPPVGAFGRLPPEDERLFLEEAAACLRAERVVRVAVPLLLDVFQVAPRGAVACRFGSYGVDLDGDADTLVRRFQPRYRTSTRSAERAGVTVRWGRAEMAAFDELYRARMAVEGKPVEPAARFEAMFDALSEAHLLCAVAYHQDRPQAAAWVPFTRAGGYYLYGAAAEATTHDGIAKLLQLEVMKRLQAAGVRRYVLGGARLSDVAGTKWERIQQFKERFGSRLTQGLVWKMDLDRVRARLYDLALRVRHGGWRRPVLDAIDEERARGAGADA